MRSHKRKEEVLKDYINSFVINPQLVEVNDFTQIFSLLDEGEIDSGIVNNFFGRKFSPDYDILKTNIVINPTRLHFIVQKGDPYGLLPNIDHQLQILINDGDSIYYSAIALFA